MHVCVHKIDRFCLNSLAHTHTIGASIFVEYFMNNHICRRVRIFVCQLIIILPKPMPMPILMLMLMPITNEIHCLHDNRFESTQHRNNSVFEYKPTANIRHVGRNGNGFISISISDRIQIIAL